ncbi:hypothetical protein CRBSH125_25270 [Afipia carboxidovorans]|nr:hypothetical protein CRBSH125_25270 [Afipia carboxidovorans]
MQSACEPPLGPAAGADGADEKPCPIGATPCEGNASGVFIGFIGAEPLIGGNADVLACCGGGAAACPGSGAGNATCA